MPTQVRDYRKLFQAEKRAADIEALHKLQASRPARPPSRRFDDSRPVTAAELDAAKAASRAPLISLRETRDAQAHE